MSYDVEGVSLNPLSDLFAAADFPLAEMIPTDRLQAAFDGLFYTRAMTYRSGGNLIFNLDLAIEGELALTPPGTDAVSLVIGGTAGWTVIPVEIVIGPDASIGIIDLPITLRVSRDVLRDVASDGPAELTLTVSLILDSNGLEFSSSATLNLAECEVAGSGVTISATGVTWNFTKGATLPAATAAGITGEFLGLAFQSVVVKLPPDIAGAPQLGLDYCCIGTGGFTGGVAVAFNAPPSCQIAGFTVELERVGIRFQESRLVMGEIEATVRNLPFFDADVAADIQLSTGGLKVALTAAADRQTGPNASVSNGLVTLTKPNIIAMSLTAIELTVTGGGGSLTLSGTITPLVKLPGGDSLPGFTVEALTITSAGDVSVSGGWINLPNALRAQLGPFGVELTRVGLGTEPNGDRWVAFSGGVSLSSGIPITAAVDGLKFRWNSAGFQGVELAGIKLSVLVPNVLYLEGQVRYDDANSRFDGAATLQLMSLNLTVSVRVVIGKRAGYTYMYLYLMVAPPVGIPIFNTGLAIYAGEALYTRNMAPAKTSAERWYQDWYKRPTLGTVDQTKWKDIEGGQAFGAGMLIGTLADKGYAVSVKGILILLLPGPVLMLDARANLLKDPSQLANPANEALFTALVVYDGNQGTIEMCVEVHYVYPNNASVIDARGIMEAFYSFNDPNAWYVYLGKRNRPDRIRAQVIKLFEANTYLMMDHSGLEMGAYIGYEKSLSAGPVRLALEAYIEGSAAISWRPKQLSGNLHMQGRVEFRIAGIGFDVGASATMSAQAPSPFELDAEVSVHANLPWPCDDWEATVHLHWETPGPPTVVAPLQAVGIKHPITSASWDLDATGGTEPVVPLDGRPSLAFERSVNDLLGVGNNAVAVGGRHVGDYSLVANLDSVTLQVLDNGAWIDYATTTSAVHPLYGAWQVQPGDSSQGNRRLGIWTRTPYDWLQTHTESATEQLEEIDNYDPCNPLGEPIRVDFNEHVDQQLAPSTAHEYKTLIWTPGALGASVQPFHEPQLVKQLTTRYYRALLLSNQFLLTTAPTSATTSTSSSSGAPTVSPPLRIEFPADMGAVTVLVMHIGDWQIAAYDASGVLLGTATSPPAPRRKVSVSQLNLQAAGIRRVDLTTSYELGVLEVAARPSASGVERTAYGLEMAQMLNRFVQPEPVLEPNRHYKLIVETSVVEADGRSLNNAVIEKRGPVTVTTSGSTCSFREEYLFQTEGPPGDANIQAISNDANASAGLVTLEPYVGALIPERGAPTVYRTYDLRVDFRADYVAQMYAISGKAVALDLRRDDGNVLTIANVLAPGREIVLRREERQWRRTLDRSSCHLSVADSAVVRETIVQGQMLAGTSLEPRRRYDALLRSDPAGALEANKPLLTWSFVSSAYLDFADHFKRVGRVRTALIQAASGVQWVQPYTGTINAADPSTMTGQARDQRMAGDPAAFDALMQLTDLDRELPQNVELTAVQFGQETWAMLLSSPEPFDWRRITLGGTVKIVVPMGCGCALLGMLGSPTTQEVTVPSAGRLLRNREGTRALIFHVEPGVVTGFPSGDHSLTATFHRDAGAELPILTAAGSVADEVATIQWTLPLP